jgi:hypothetical protein
VAKGPEDEEEFAWFDSFEVGEFEQWEPRVAYKMPRSWDSMRKRAFLGRKANESLGIAHNIGGMVK